jgi:hypothetical protein
MRKDMWVSMLLMKSATPIGTSTRSSGTSGKALGRMSEPVY